MRDLSELFRSPAAELVLYGRFSLQKFKLNIANTVVNEQNSGLESMNTDQVLDLFNADTTAANQPGNASAGGVSGKSHVLEG